MPSGFRSKSTPNSLNVSFTPSPKHTAIIPYFFASVATGVLTSSDINKNNVDDILKTEIGIVFAEVLEHAGVYKQTEKGIEAFDAFMRQI